MAEKTVINKTLYIGRETDDTNTLVETNVNGDLIIKGSIFGAGANKDSTIINPIFSYPAIVLGKGSYTTDSSSLVIGHQNYIDCGDSSTVLGSNNNIQNSGRITTIIGHNNFTDYQQSISDSVVIGENNRVGGSMGTIIGQNCQYSGITGIAIGASAYVYNTSSIAIGSQATANGNFGVAIGQGTTASKSSFAGGDGSKTIGEKSIAIGCYNTSGKRNRVDVKNISIGSSNTAEGTSNIAIGDSNTVTGPTAIGENGEVLTQDREYCNNYASIALGYNNTINDNPYSMTVGKANQILANGANDDDYLSRNNYIFGTENKIESQNQYNFVIGQENELTFNKSEAEDSDYRTINKIGYNLVLGYANDISSGAYNFVKGDRNKFIESRSLVLSDYIYPADNEVLGSDNEIYGHAYHNSIHGHDNIISSTTSFAYDGADSGTDKGRYNSIIGSNNTISNGGFNFILGTTTTSTPGGNSITNSDHNTIFGNGNTIDDNFQLDDSYRPRLSLIVGNDNTHSGLMYDSLTVGGRNTIINTTGKQITSSGDWYSLTRYNFIVGGSNTITDAGYNIISGANNTSTHDHVTLYGQRLTSGKNYQTIVGYSNAVSTGATFIVASGTLENPKNLLEVGSTSKFNGALTIASGDLTVSSGNIKISATGQLEIKHSSASDKAFMHFYGANSAETYIDTTGKLTTTGDGVFQGGSVYAGGSSHDSVTYVRALTKENNASILAQPSSVTTPRAGLYHQSTSGYNANRWLVAYTKTGTFETNIASDKRLKENINTLSKNDADLYLSSSVKTFNYKNGNTPLTGIIAQELRDILIKNNLENKNLIRLSKINPENEEDAMNVYEDITLPEEEYTYNVDYLSFVPILIKGYQINKEKIQELEKKIKELENKLNN